MSLTSIIVTYNPSLIQLKKLVMSQLNVARKLIIVDNGSDNVQGIIEHLNCYDNVFIINLGSNTGIANAQNKAVDTLVNTNEDELIVFFDQDSNIDSEYLNVLEREYFSIEKLTNKELILGPNFFHVHSKFEYPVIKLNKFGVRKKFYPSIYPHPTSASCIISSGMAMRKKVLDLVGPMDDSLFIDYVDTEWCLRAKSKGVNIMVSPKLVMEHEIGIENIKLFKWLIPVHSAKRRYYRVRNSIYLSRYPHVPSLVAIREVIFSFVHQTLLILLASDRFEQFRSLLRGVKDGILRKTGPRN